MSALRIRILPLMLLVGAVLLVTGRPAHAAFVPPNDNLAQRTLLPFSQPFTVTSSNINATEEISSGEPDHAGYTPASSVWFAWGSPYMNGTVTIDTLGSDFDTVLAVYTSCCGPNYGPTLVPLISNDNGDVDQTSSVTFEFTKDYPHFLAVDGVGGAQGNMVLNLRIDPFNDNFVDAIPITGTSTASPYWDHNTNATKEAGEPDHAGNAGGKSVWYSWTAPQTADVSMFTYDTEFDTLMAVYTGFGVPAVVSNDDGPNPINPGGSEVRFRATSGVTYYIAIDGKNGASGLFNFYLQQSPVHDDFADSMLLTGTSINRTDTNQHATGEPGEPDHSSFVQEAGGHSLWYRWTAPSGGCISLDTTGTQTFDQPPGTTHVHTMIGVYTGSALNTLTKVGESRTDRGHARFSMAVTGGLTYRIALDTFQSDPDFGRQEGLLKLKLTHAQCPTLRIYDASVSEGNSGTRALTFSVALSAPVPQQVAVNWVTSDGNATFTDYNGAGGTVTFPPNQTLRTITVQVLGDLATELNETFKVNLSSPFNALIADGLGVGTIQNDDPAVLRVADVTVTEGNSGTTNAIFNVTLSGPVAGQVTVQYATANGSATDPSDYKAKTGTATFLSGATSLNVLVQVVGDTATELNETFTLNLSSPSGATIADGVGVGTIPNDDAATLRVADVAVTEGNSGTKTASFAVSLSGPVSQQVTVNFATGDGTATAPGDYQAKSGTLTFIPGSVSQNVLVQVQGDTTAELNETLTLDIFTATNATIADSRGVGSITNDDVPRIFINDVVITEGNSGTQNAIFTITLSGPVSQAVSVSYATADGSATSPSDYLARSGTITFVPGVTVQTVVVQIVGDLVPEGLDQFVVNLSSPVNGTIADAQGFGSIINND